MEYGTINTTNSTPNVVTIKESEVERAPINTLLFITKEDK